jgi:hypothetical protein
MVADSTTSPTFAPDVTLLDPLIPNVMTIITPEGTMLNEYEIAMVATFSGIETEGKAFLNSNSRTELVSGKEKSSSTTSSLDKQTTTITNNFDVLDMVSTLLNLIFTILFSVLIAISIFCTLIILLVYLKKVYCLRFFIHLTWFLYCLIMVIGFLLGVIIHPMAKGMAEVCIYLDQYFTDKTFFESHNLIA